MEKAQDVQDELKKHINQEKKDFLPRFFKMGRGEYAEGDKFLGVMVPNQRKVAKKFKNLALREVKKLLDSQFHEERLTGLFILTWQFQNTHKEKEREIIAKFYIRNISAVNNWDLVDATAHKILGPYLRHREKDLLYNWSRSKSLWKRRVAIVSTWHFIRKGEFQDTLKIARELLQDQQDLIHKGVGWMLREVGKRDMATLESFLQNYHKVMPRTMLRYAIEKFPEAQRRIYLKKKLK